MSAAETIEAAPSELRPVPGPSPIAGGGRRFFDLLWVMAVTDFKLTFHGTALGYAWSLVRPLLVFGVLLAVFTQVFRFGDQVQDYPALLLLNVMLFSLFSDATQRAVISVVERERIVRRTQFPRLVIPLAIVLTEVFNLALNLLAVLVFILAYGVEPTWTWLLLPVIVAALMAITIAVSMIVSALYPRFRDVALIWSVLSTVLFYATPILYPISVAPQRFRDILQLNPLTPVFEQAQKWIIDPNAPGALGDRAARSTCSRFRSPSSSRSARPPSGSSTGSRRGSPRNSDTAAVGPRSFQAWAACRPKGFGPATRSAGGLPCRRREAQPSFTSRRLPRTRGHRRQWRIRPVTRGAFSSGSPRASRHIARRAHAAARTSRRHDLGAIRPRPRVGGRPRQVEARVDAGWEQRHARGDPSRVSDQLIGVYRDPR